ncbi:MAG: hypothetical protein ABI472_15145 [Ginsengibacter sp.]
MYLIIWILNDTVLMAFVKSRRLQNLQGYIFNSYVVTPLLFIHENWAGTRGNTNGQVEAPAFTLKHQIRKVQLAM